MNPRQIPGALSNMSSDDPSSESPENGCGEKAVELLVAV